jgi:hypothetical protein
LRWSDKKIVIQQMGAYCKRLHFHLLRLVTHMTSTASNWQ